MNRPGEPTVEELMARIAALQGQNRHLTERVVKLEEELALARLHRFAPKSEKHIDRLFNSMKSNRPRMRTPPTAKMAMSLSCRTRACRRAKGRRERSAAARPCRKTCRA